MAQGLKTTSMDAIAKRAGVSKQTLYSHFKNKDDLFSAVLRWKMNQHQFSDEAPIEFSGDLETDLNLFGQHFIGLLVDPEACAMFRSVIGESPNYPRVSRLFYENGPQRIREILRAYLAEQGVQDPEFHAGLFTGALNGELHMSAMMNLDEVPPRRELNQYVARVVKVFLPLFREKRAT
ncbi:MAG: Transcriptional regulator [Marinobacter excellens HL-55]|uniref:Transcriptional regulator n=1 Tax=Marinobacter excellens HL-55 TaxID=1305731 RepID=A0A0P7YAK4_9GAMM|nr:MAG: Transcriptional regulator [Marinobacter excellens HL-55]